MPGHLLLALTSADCFAAPPPMPALPAREGVACKALKHLGVDVDALHDAAEATLPPASVAHADELKKGIGYTRKAKAVVMDYAPEAARSLGRPEVGTEHLLLGLFAVPETQAVLKATGAREEAVRSAIIKLIADPS